MNAVNSNTKSWRDNYLEQVFDILIERTMEFHAIVPPHEFLSSIIASGIHGGAILNRSNGWVEFNHYFASLNLPFHVIPIEVDILETLDIEYRFMVIQNLHGAFAGESFELMACISSDHDMYLHMNFAEDLEHRITEHDWCELAKSVKQKYMLLKLDEA